VTDKPSTETYIRLVLWYVTAVASISAVPYLSVVLSDAGVGAGSIATILLLMPIGRIFGAPFWGWIADRTAAHQLVFRAATLLGAVSGLGFIFAETPALLAGSVLLMALSRAPVFPIADATTVSILGEDRRNYGKIRAAGSIAFLVAIGSGGILRSTWPRAPLILGGILLVVTAAISWGFPQIETPPRRPTLKQLGKVLVHPILLPLMGIFVLHGMTITAYDSLFSLHVETLGFEPWVTGTAISLGVGVEVVVLMSGRRLLDRFGPIPLLLFAVAVGIPRWLITGSTGDPYLLMATQALHGFHFGAFWIAGVALFSEQAPKNLAASAQALLPASTFGVGYFSSMALASVLLGPLTLQQFFGAMAGVSALATILTGILYFRTPSASYSSV